MRAVHLRFPAVILLLMLAACSPVGQKLLPTTGPTALTIHSTVSGPLETPAAPPSDVPSAESPTVAPTAIPTAELPTATPTDTSTAEPPTVGPTAVPPTAMPTAVSPTAIPADDTLVEERTIGEYTLHLWQPAPGTGMYSYAIIWTPGQPEIRIETVSAIGNLPAEDITGDGFPDVELETYAGGSHCCSGTVVYSLGPTAEEVLSIIASGSNDTGRGTFQDLDGDGVYEFITADPLAGIPCTQPFVKAILRYEPGQGYVGSSPRFSHAYVQDLAAYTQAAEASREATRDGYECDVYPLIVTYLYIGQNDMARQTLERYYLGPDPDGFFARLEQAVAAGRFYVPE